MRRFNDHRSSSTSGLILLPGPGITWRNVLSAACVACAGGLPESGVRSISSNSASSTTAFPGGVGAPDPALERGATGEEARTDDGCFAGMSVLSGAAVDVRSTGAMAMRSEAP